MFRAGLFRAFMFRAFIFAGASAGAGSGTANQGGGIIYLPSRRRRKHETEDERRARIFAEIVGDIEAVDVPQQTPAVAAKAVAKIAKRAERIAVKDDAEDRRPKWNALLAALDAASRRTEIDREAQQRVALTVAYQIEQMMLADLAQDEDDAIVALLLSD